MVGDHGSTGDGTADGEGVTSPPAHRGAATGEGPPSDGSVPLAPETRPSAFEEQKSGAERAKPEGGAERAEPEGEAPERADSAVRLDDQGQAGRCHAQADHGAGNWSASQLKAELKARGVSELAITACSEKRELIELLAAATDTGRGVAEGMVSEAGGMVVPEAAAGHAAIGGAVGADETLPRQPSTEKNARPSEPEAAAARQTRCYRRITPAPADSMRTGRLWNSPSPASNGTATSVSCRLLLSPGASQVLPCVLEIASRSSSGAACTSALSTAGYAGIASRAPLREFQDRVHALDSAPLVLKHW